MSRDLLSLQLCERCTCRSSVQRGEGVAKTRTGVLVEAAHFLFVSCLGLSHANTRNL